MSVFEFFCIFAGSFALSSGLGQFEGIPVHVAFTPEVNKERFKDIQHWKPAGEGAETQEEVGHRMFKFVSEKV